MQAALNNLCNGITVPSLTLKCNEIEQSRWPKLKCSDNGDISFLAGAESLEERMKISTDGMVGIGTTKPFTKLHIVEEEKGPESSGYGNPWVWGKHIEIGSSQMWGLKDSYGSLFTWDSDSMFVGLKNEGSNRKDAVIAWGDDYDDMLRFMFTPHGDPASNPVEVMRLIPAGNVGIGTPEPNTKLHIFGGKDASLKNDSGFLVVGSMVSTNIVMDDNEIMARNNGEKSALHLQAEGGDLIVHSLQDRSTKFIITDSGKVGIGTSPGEKLHVNGSVRGNQSGALRINTGNEYVDIGPKNTNWSHFYTDRERYYFDKEIRVDSGFIGSYDEDLQLRTQGTTRITIRKDNGNVTIEKQLTKLDVADNFTATVRAADFKLGYSDRRGSPGRALVDYKDNGNKILILNYGGDWAQGVQYYVSLTKRSSRELKENINNLSYQEAFETLVELNPIKFNLKVDDKKMLHLGFIAEDAPDLVTDTNKKAINNDHIVAILTKVMKEQHKTILSSS